MCCLQLKDMVLLKFSGSNKHHHYKGSARTPTSFRSGGGSYRRPYPGFIDDTTFTPAASKQVSGEDYYPRTGFAAAAGGKDTLEDVTKRHGAGKCPGGSGWIPTAEGEVAVEAEAHDVPREWTAQVEPGVQITFGSIPGGGNDLKRIRFRCCRYNSRCLISFCQACCGDRVRTTLTRYD